MAAMLFHIQQKYDIKKWCTFFRFLLPCH